MISDIRKYFKKIGESELREEEYEILPGRRCVIRFEGNTNEIARKFLKREATIGELRKAVKR